MDPYLEMRTVIYILSEWHYVIMLHRLQQKEYLGDHPMIGNWLWVIKYKRQYFKRL